MKKIGEGFNLTFVATQIHLGADRMIVGGKTYNITDEMREFFKAIHPISYPYPDDKRVTVYKKVKRDYVENLTFLSAIKTANYMRTYTSNKNIRIHSGCNDIDFDSEDIGNCYTTEWWEQEIAEGTVKPSGRNWFVSWEAE